MDRDTQINVCPYFPEGTIVGDGWIVDYSDESDYDDYDSSDYEYDDYYYS